MNLKSLKLILPARVYDEAVRKYKSAVWRAACHVHPASRGTANLECAPGNEPVGTKKGARFSSPVCIYIHSYRRRLADPDGVSAKAAIDGLRYSGILSDDTTRQIEEISYRQTKIKGEEEYTLIHILPRVKEATISK